MKRSWIWAALLLIVGLSLLGCSSPQDKAQKLFNAGQYEELVAKYGNDAQLAGLVAQAKEKLAEGLLAEGKFEDVVKNYPESAAAKVARNKLAEQLFAEKKYQEVIDQYGDTPAAQLAKMELDRAKSGENKPATGTTPGGKDNSAELKARNAAAQAELDRILKIKVPDLKQKALREFVAKAEFAGTDAVKKAQAEIK